MEAWSVGGEMATDMGFDIVLAGAEVYDGLGRIPMRTELDIYRI